LEFKKLPEIRFELRPAGPFRLDLTAWALRRRPENEIDEWDGRFYRRIFFVARAPILVSVRQAGSIDKPRLEVTACSANSLKRRRETLTATLERTLGLRVDLHAFYEMADHDAKIRTLVHRFIGFRPPRFPSIFEAMVNAIACQQLSLTVGIILLNRLARAYGCGSMTGRPTPLGFPSPEDIAKLRPGQLSKLGFSRQKAHALIGVASRLSACDLAQKLEQLGDALVLKELLQLHGIGRWSAEYVMLRGLRRLGVFPADDIAGQKNLHRWLRLRKIPSYERARQLLARWHPYQGLLYFHFLLANLEERGQIIVQDGRAAEAG
jgi:DNA-3-methyladenine glycosylase II